MKNEDGIIRQQEFNKNGELTKDTYKGTVQTYIPPEYLPEKLKIDFESAKSETENILTSAFNYRMVADVPVGMFLSGGYDSTY